MVDPVLLDFESRSRANLKQIGGRNYWAHPSTEPLCCVWYDTANGEVGVWSRDNPKGRPPRGRQYGAHNADGFDRFAAERLGWSKPGEPWVDTARLATNAGYKRALEDLGKAIGVPKDMAASRFTAGLSTCRRPAGKGNPAAISAAAWKALSPGEKARLGVQAEVTPGALARVIGYCARDVQIMAETWPLLESWRELEPDVVAVDRTINDRGIPFDSALAEALLECDAYQADRVVRRVAKQLGMRRSEVRAAARSPQQFTRATGAPNAQAETVAALDHPLARAREAMASIVAGKLRAGLARVSPDGMLRDSHLYYGAHTGRFSSVGMQTHNMTRPEKRFEDWTDDDICKLADRVIARKHVATQAESDMLLRATLWGGEDGELVDEDFSGVEARGLAWASGDAKALEVFRTGRNPYSVMASKIFGVPYDRIVKGDPLYTVGKQAELACGYGQGGRKFAETAAKGGADLAAAGVDPDTVVTMWRTLHGPSVKFWYAIEKAFRLAIEGHASKVACFDVQPSADGQDVAIFLPSGRPIVYVGAHLAREKGRRGQSIVYRGGKTGREYTYGGKLTENAISGMCRDLLVRALVKAEKAGLRPVMHVHDSVGCLVPRGAGKDGQAALHAIMTSLPAWAKGFPIGAAGFHGRRWRK